MSPESVRLIPLLALLGLASVALALEVPPLTGRIVDRADLLPPEIETSLAEELADHERQTGNQIALLIVPTLAGELLEEYAHRVASVWLLGQRGTDNGVLILIVPEDRKARIEVGYGLEGMLTDAQASRILREQMIPRFKAGRYAEGIVAGSRAVMHALGGKAMDERSVPPAPPVRGIQHVIAAAFFGIIVGAMVGAGLRLLSGTLGGGLAFALATSAGWRLAAVAGGIGFIGALALAGLVRAGKRGGASRGWRDPWTGLGAGGSWPGGGWSSHDSFSGRGGTFGGGGASGRW